jgi:hypothetical protein
MVLGLCCGYEINRITVVARTIFTIHPKCLYFLLYFLLAYTFTSAISKDLTSWDPKKLLYVE